MKANRRKAKWEKPTLQILARAWQARFALALALSYLILVGWLFAGGSDTDIRPSVVLTIPDNPAWKMPDHVHWFGTTGSGADLFQLSRIAMARSLALAALTSGLGVFLGALTVMLFAAELGERRFRPLGALERATSLVPGMLILLILVAGSGGSAAVMIVAMAILLGLRLTPDIVRQFEEGERRSDKTSGIVLGLKRTEIVRNRVVPLVVRRLVGAFAVHIPVIVLAEMSLSFLGYSGGRLSCGNLVAYGREVIVEAPWVAVCPGLLATAVVLVLALLGWISSRALGTDLGTRPF